MDATGLDRMTVADIQAGLESGSLTSRSVVEAHLDRIVRLDPAFGAIRCLSPAALAEADDSDRVRREHGPRSPIDGIPVLVKDNIDVAGLPTTGGALALANSHPTQDAPVVARLRSAGAIILGKTNLSELANFLTDNMPSGYSSLGGQVLNPYDTSITPSGSSSGSGAAAALGFAPLTVGTETDGSITSPADQQSVVGMKPTVGLVSQGGILPIAASQDTAGPMTRTVAGAAALLAVMAGPDPVDLADRRDVEPWTPDPARAAQTAAQLQALVLESGRLAGVRLGVVRDDLPDGEQIDEHQAACYDEALAALVAAGAVLTDVTLPRFGHDDELTVLHYEFGPGVERYLANLGSGAPLRTLADIQAWNQAHPDAALKFGQSHVDAAVAVDHARDRDAYCQARLRDYTATTAALTAALGDTLECLVFPGATGCSLAARAGWPSIVIPAGYTANSRRPVGIMLVSRPWTDARLLALAFALEQAHPVRRTPAEVNPAAFRGR